MNTLTPEQVTSVGNNMSTDNTIKVLTPPVTDVDSLSEVVKWLKNDANSSRVMRGTYRGVENLRYLYHAPLQYTTDLQTPAMLFMFKAMKREQTHIVKLNIPATSIYDKNGLNHIQSVKFQIYEGLTDNEDLSQAWGVNTEIPISEFPKTITVSNTLEPKPNTVYRVIVTYKTKLDPNSSTLRTPDISFTTYLYFYQEVFQSGLPPMSERLKTASMAILEMKSDSGHKTLLRSERAEATDVVLEVPIAETGVLATEEYLEKKLREGDNQFTAFISKPVVLAPQEGAKKYMGDFTSSAFKATDMFRGELTHVEWEIADSEDFSNIVHKAKDGPILTHRWIDTESDPRWVRVRHVYENKDILKEPVLSLWSDPVNYEPAGMFIEPPVIEVSTLKGKMLLQPEIKATNEFKVVNTTDTHVSTSWEVINKSTGEEAWSSKNDTVNKRSIIMPYGKLVKNTEYIVRVTYNGAKLTSPTTAYYTTVNFHVELGDDVQTGSDGTPIAEKGKIGDVARISNKTYPNVQVSSQLLNNRGSYLTNRAYRPGDVVISNNEWYRAANTNKSLQYVMTADAQTSLMTYHNTTRSTSGITKSNFISTSGQPSPWIHEKIGASENMYFYGRSGSSNLSEVRKFVLSQQNTYHAMNVNMRHYNEYELTAKTIDGEIMVDRIYLHPYKSPELEYMFPHNIGSSQYTPLILGVATSYGSGDICRDLVREGYEGAVYLWVDGTTSLSIFYNSGTRRNVQKVISGINCTIYELSGFFTIGIGYAGTPPSKVYSGTKSYFNTSISISRVTSFYTKKSQTFSVSVLQNADLSNTSYWQKISKDTRVDFPSTQYAMHQLNIMNKVSGETLLKNQFAKRTKSTIVLPHNTHYHKVNVLSKVLYMPSKLSLENVSPTEIIRGFYTPQYPRTVIFNDRYYWARILTEREYTKIIDGNVLVNLPKSSFNNAIFGAAEDQELNAETSFKKQVNSQLQPMMVTDQDDNKVFLVYEAIKKGEEPHRRTFNTPGPNDLVYKADGLDVGFFGYTSGTDLFTQDEMISLCRISDGEKITCDDSKLWLKFYWHGYTVYIATKPFINNIKGQDLYNAGLIDGWVKDPGKAPYSGIRKGTFEFIATVPTFFSGIGGYSYQTYVSKVAEYKDILSRKPESKQNLKHKFSREFADSISQTQPGFWNELFLRVVGPDQTVDNDPFIVFGEPKGKNYANLSFAESGLDQYETILLDPFSSSNVFASTVKGNPYELKINTRAQGTGAWRPVLILKERIYQNIEW